jgi:aminocarboxymuconate-semialdehyde decarboxylase
VESRERHEDAPVVDVHAHLFPAELPDLGGRTGDGRWPTLITGDGGGRIMRGDTAFRQVRPPLWDRSARLVELDAAGVGIQVVSPVPVTLTYWADVQSATEFTKAMNDALAAEVADSGGRLVGLGAVPLQDVDVAIDELVRIVTELGLSGAEIGTVVAGRELDDPQLRPPVPTWSPTSRTTSRTGTPRSTRRTLALACVSRTSGLRTVARCRTSWAPTTPWST